MSRASKNKTGAVPEKTHWKDLKYFVYNYKHYQQGPSPWIQPGTLRTHGGYKRFQNVVTHSSQTYRRLQVFVVFD